LFHSNQFSRPLLERLRDGLGRRATGIAVALLLEAILILLLFTLGRDGSKPEEAGSIISTFDAGSDPEDAAEPESEEPEQEQSSEPQPTAQQPEQAQPQPEVAPPTPQQQQTPPPAFVLVPRNDVPDISAMPRAPAAPAAPAAQPQQTYGPPAGPRAGDSQRVGTAPNGQPLYAAAWYREPYDNELAGYLSTAQGPGWGLIACRTAPDFRVEDCVALDESPARSNIARAVVAAAWQFQVRPPRVGGKSQVGEWVRIRIDYGIRRN